MLTLALAAFSLLACKNESMKPQSGYIGPADLKIEDGRMTPEVLLSLGRLSDPQLSPDGKTILYGVSYTSIADNRSVRNLFTLPVEGGDPTQLTMDGKSIKVMEKDSATARAPSRKIPAITGTNVSMTPARRRVPPITIRPQRSTSRIP